MRVKYRPFFSRLLVWVNDEKVVARGGELQLGKPQDLLQRFMVGSNECLLKFLYLDHGSLTVMLKYKEEVVLPAGSGEAGEIRAALPGVQFYMDTLALFVMSFGVGVRTWQWYWAEVLTPLIIAGTLFALICGWGIYVRQRAKLTLTDEEIVCRTWRGQWQLRWSELTTLSKDKIGVLRLSDDYVTIAISPEMFPDVPAIREFARSRSGLALERRAVALEAFLWRHGLAVWIFFALGAVALWLWGARWALIIGAVSGLILGYKTEGGLAVRLPRIVGASLILGMFVAELSIAMRSAGYALGIVLSLLVGLALGYVAPFVYSRKWLGAEFERQELEV
ncbi:MAG: hypothetical protein FH749_11295 [Firmicutes bacterium]|nr:hypothetical protein [Bacillota bacterium]